jgi:hypothetical protein
MPIVRATLNICNYLQGNFHAYQPVDSEEVMADAVEKGAGLLPFCQR